MSIKKESTPDTAMSSGANSNLSNTSMTENTPNVKQKVSDKKSKCRNWAFVLYPESAPADWVETLQKSGLQCAISPLHNKDKNPDNTEKKAHFHIILVYSGPTSFNVVSNFTKSLNQPIPQRLESVRGYYRYLTHKDNPEKAQYNENEVQCLNGFALRDFIELTKTEVLKIKKEVIAFCRDNDIIEYADLTDILMQNEQFADWFDVVSSHTLFFNSYLKSRRHSATRYDKTTATTEKE